MARGADPDRADRYGWTALHLAAPTMDRRTVSGLLRAGADPNARTANGLTALHLAADWPVVLVLLAAGAEIDAQDDRGRTPLHQAALYRDAAVVEALLDAGADPMLRNYRVELPADLAVFNPRIDKDSEVMRRLRGSDTGGPR